MRAPAPLDNKVRRLIHAHDLAMVHAHWSARHVYVSAEPSHTGARVHAAREAAIQALGGSITLAEAETITRTAVASATENAIGDSLDEAITNLKTALEKP